MSRSDHGSRAANPGGVVVVGSINMDLVTRVRAFPRPGETLLGSDYAAHHGGKGANQAVAAARMGAKVRFIGRVGGDAFGARIRQALEVEGIDVSLVREVPSPSGVAFITLDEEGQNTIIVAPGANHQLKPNELGAEMFAGTAIVLLQLEIPLGTVQRCLQLAEEAGACVVVNAAPADRVQLADLQGADVLIVNESEAAGLLDRGGQPFDAPTALGLLGRRFPSVVITLGAQGAVWQTGGVAGHVPALPVQVIDTTAAGDAFVGALTAALAQGNAWTEAVRLASAAGALAVTRKGAQPSLPYETDVRRFLEQVPANVSGGELESVHETDH